MDCSSHEFFPGATLALDQDGAVALGDEWKSPYWFRSSAVLTLMETFRREEVWIFTCLLISGEPVDMVALWAQAPSQMSTLKTFQQGFPNVSSGVIPMISAAARLKKVMRKLSSTVNTPTSMESRSVRRSDESLSEAAQD